MSLSNILVYSPKALKRIKTLIKGKYSYIVQGIPSNYDIKLSIELCSPLLNGDPQKANSFSMKSGAKRLFNKIGIPTPVGAYEIYDSTEFFNTLTLLIINN